MKIMDKKGFTLIEAMVVVVIIGIATGIAVLNIVGALPNYRLKRAARDLYSGIQFTKMGSIKSFANWAIVFDTATGRYLICSNRGADGSWSNTVDNTIVKTVSLPDYGSGITYGHGIATTNVTAACILNLSGVGCTTFPADDVSYNWNVLVFNFRGTGSGGYIYLQNNQNTSYSVGTRTSGAILLRKWYSAGWL